MRTLLFLLVLVGCSPAPQPPPQVPSQPSAPTPVQGNTKSPLPASAPEARSDAPEDVANAMLPLWSPVQAPVMMEPPKRFVIPNVNTIEDFVVDERGRAYALGTLGELFAIDDGRVTQLIGSFVERDEEGNPINFGPTDREHGIYCSNQDLFTLGSSPGVGTPRLQTSHLSREGKPLPNTAAVSLWGSNDWQMHHSGGALWVTILGAVSRIFPEPALNIPNPPTDLVDSWIPLGMTGSPPGYLDKEGNLHRYNGVRWELSRIEEPSGTRWVSWTIDAESNLWGVVEDDRTHARSVVHNDGNGWRRGVVAGLEAPTHVASLGGHTAWIIGEKAVAKYVGDRIVLSRDLLQGTRHYLDQQGRLWTYAPPEHGPPEDLFDTVDWTVLLFTGEETQL